jgi:hypothetical protein
MHGDGDLVVMPSSLDVVPLRKILLICRGGDMMQSYDVD